MGRIPDELVERVRDTADLLEIVQESVQLKRTGADWRGPCPFHGGTNRNFSVVPRKNMYYCFVCHAAGDVFTWYRERFGMDYPTAVREVARRYGITIPESTERIGPDPREPLYQACDAAMQWYATRLREAPDAEPARRYLQDRQIMLDAAGELRLGWAPRSGEDFLVAMRSLGIADAALEEAALVTRRDDGTLAPRFRNRVLFPIHDLRGRAVGFGGRLLGPGEPKYLNSPETPIFHKGEQLYHMDVARLAIRKAEVALVVEGYFDVIRLSLAGIDHVVAPLGTALTEAQAKLLRRYGAEVVLIYDSDAAGLKASFRAADTLLAEGARVRVVTMPDGEDPDTLVQRGGAAALQALIDDAVDVLDRKIQLLEQRGWFADMHRRREALDRLLPTLRAATDPVLREMYTTRVAEQMGIPREAVATEVANVRPRAAPVASEAMRRTEAFGGGHQAPTPERDARHPGAEIERKLLRLLVHHPDWLARAREELPAERFAVPSFRRIFEALAALDPDRPVGDAALALDERALAAWERLATDPAPPDADFGVDHEYVGALEALEERDLFESIATEPDTRERIRRRQALSREGRERYNYYLKARKRADGPTAHPYEE
ncbi:MAG: DNA primase [Gemmatimonadetes bacterium]|nr:DNA primase [Gemmatimonadota bacterium]